MQVDDTPPVAAIELVVRAEAAFCVIGEDEAGNRGEPERFDLS